MFHRTWERSAESEEDFGSIPISAGQYVETAYAARLVRGFDVRRFVVGLELVSGGFATRKLGKFDRHGSLAGGGEGERRSAVERKGCAHGRRSWGEDLQHLATTRGSEEAGSWSPKADDLWLPLC